jgi:uncharacterized protein YbjT (DUF2867 family)
MLFITGASGRMGGAVLRHVEMSTRAGTRSGASVIGAGETVPFDLSDPGSFARALSDVDALFLIRPPTITKRAPFDALMRTASRAGVKFVVCA